MFSCELVGKTWMRKDNIINACYGLDAGKQPGGL